METQKITREDLIALVKKIMSAAGTEDQIYSNIGLLEKNVPDPQVSAYIYWPDKEMTAEEIVDKALMYKPICL